MGTKKTNPETVSVEKQEAKEAAVVEPKKSEIAATETVKEETTTSEAMKEAQYTHQQLIDGFKAFETTRAIVATALRGVKEELLTEKEAKEIINAFKNKER